MFQRSDEISQVENGLELLAGKGKWKFQTSEKGREIKQILEIHKEEIIETAKR
jgi:hypothetical protein